MSWTCQIHRFPEQQVEGFEGITVGEVLELGCAGELVEFDSQENIRFVQPKEAPLAFKILEMKELTPTGGKILMTTYLAPQKEWAGLALTDGSVSWDLQIEGEAVVSVLPEDSAEPPVPYGPYGPFVLGWPLWIFLLLIPVLLVLAVPARLIWLRWSRSKKLREALDKRVGAGKISAGVAGEKAATLNFHKAQRHIVKSLYAFRAGTLEERAQVIKKMGDSLTDFLLEEFQVLVNQELSSREEKVLAKQLKPSARAQLVKDLKMILTELGRAGRDLQNVNVDQAQHLLELTRDLVLALEESHKRKGKAHGVA